MDRTTISYIEDYFTKFKTDIQKKAIELSFNDKDKLNELLEFIFEYEKINTSREYFTKKKIKKTPTTLSSSVIEINTEIDNSKRHVVKDEERCNAERKQGDRCCRKRVKGSLYCGTHFVKYNNTNLQNELSLKNGESNNPNNSSLPINNKENSKEQIEVVAYEIQGIIYYIDKELNVYNTEDIFKNKKNPRIIAKAVKISNNVFSIPSLGL